MVEVHILPFFYQETKEEVEIEANLENEIIVFMGSQLKRKEFNNKVPVSLNDNDFEGKLIYWYPSEQSKSFVDRAMDLITNGIGFGKSKL